MTFNQKILERAKKANTLVCVGLDPDRKKMPNAVGESIFDFNKAIIDATAEYTCVYKPQIAYYAAQNADEDLKRTIDYIHKNYPDIPVILDAKRGDIGNTSEMYAREAFERYNADAVTLNPYMGQDSLKPFLNYKEKGCVLLCRTSNAGGAEFQDLDCDGAPLYLKVAKSALTSWNKNNNVSLVLGATYPEQLGTVRKLDDNAWFLVPGIGAQGGSVEDTLKAGLNSEGLGMLISSSRGIIYASQDANFAEAAGSAAKALCEQINKYR